ncbi:hypothetical protein [Tsuneonella sp. HG222]
MADKAKGKAVGTILDAQGKELMAVRKIERDGSDLVIRGKIFGTMPMAARLTPGEARKLFRLLDARTVLFLVTLLFRR